MFLQCTSLVKHSGLFSEAWVEPKGSAFATHLPSPCPMDSEMTNSLPSRAVLGFYGMPKSQASSFWGSKYIKEAENHWAIECPRAGASSFMPMSHRPEGGLWTNYQFNINNLSAKGFFICSPNIVSVRPKIVLSFYFHGRLSNGLHAGWLVRASRPGCQASTGAVSRYQASRYDAAYGQSTEAMQRQWM